MFILDQIFCISIVIWDIDSKKKNDFENLIKIRVGRNLLAEHESNNNRKLEEKKATTACEWRWYIHQLIECGFAVDHNHSRPTAHDRHCSLLASILSFFVIIGYSRGGRSETRYSFAFAEISLCTPYPATTNRWFMDWIIARPYEFLMSDKIHKNEKNKNERNEHRLIIECHIKCIDVAKDPFSV